MNILLNNPVHLLYFLSALVPKLEQYRDMSETEDCIDPLHHRHFVILNTDETITIINC